MTVALLKASFAGAAPLAWRLNVRAPPVELPLVSVTIR